MLHGRSLARIFLVSPRAPKDFLPYRVLLASVDMWQLFSFGSNRMWLVGQKAGTSSKFVHDWTERPNHPRSYQHHSPPARIHPSELLGLFRHRQCAMYVQTRFQSPDMFLGTSLTASAVILSLCGACIFLTMILFKYLQTRRRLNTWLTLDYGKAASATTASSAARSRISTLKYRRSRAHSGTQASATFDKWLVVRLTIAFMTLWYVSIPLPPPGSSPAFLEPEVPQLYLARASCNRLDAE